MRKNVAKISPPEGLHRLFPLSFVSIVCNMYKNKLSILEKFINNIF